MNRWYLAAAIKLGLLFSSVALCQLALVQGSATPPFRWSERLAHELSCQNTIAKTKDLAANERSALLAFVLHRFHHPINARDAEAFAGISASQFRKLAADTRVELVDLDADGRREIIAQGSGLGPCSGSGNCIVLILRATSAGFELLLDSRSGEHGGGFEKIRVMEQTTNGFHDVVLASHMSASERTLGVFRFSGTTYRWADCYRVRRVFPAGGQGPSKLDIARGCTGDK